MSEGDLQKVIKETIITYKEITLGVYSLYLKIVWMNFESRKKLMHNQKLLDGAVKMLDCKNIVVDGEMKDKRKGEVLFPEVDYTGCKKKF